MEIPSVVTQVPESRRAVKVCVLLPKVHGIADRQSIWHRETNTTPDNFSLKGVEARWRREGLGAAMEQDPLPGSVTSGVGLAQILSQVASPLLPTLFQLRPLT